MESGRRRRVSASYDRRNAFVRQAAILAGAGIVVRTLGFFYRVPVTNLIGDEGNGVGAIGHIVYVFFWIMSSAGLPVAISKMVSERVAKGRPDEARRVFHVSLVTATLLGVVCSFVLLFGSEIIVNLLGEPRSHYALMALTPTVFIVAIMSVFRGYFQGMQNTVPTAFSQIIEQIFNAVFSVLLAWLVLRVALPYAHGGDPIAMGAAGAQAGTSVGAFAGLAFILGYYLFKRREISRSIHFYSVGERNKKQPAGEIVRELAYIAVPLILGTAIFSMSNIIDAMMVRTRLEASGILDPDVISVLYGQLMGKYVPIANVPVAIPAMLAVAAIPAIAASVAKRDRAAVTVQVNTAIRLSMLITIPAAVGIGVLAHPILLLLFPAHPEGGEILMAGALSIVFLALYQILAGMLQAVGKLHIPAIAAFIGAFLKIPLNFVLLAHPNIRIIGAVISTTVCYAVASGICWYFFTKHVKSKIDIRGVFVTPGMAALVMGMGTFVAYYVFYFLSSSNAAATILAILTGMFLYAVFLLILGGLHKSDVQFLPKGHKLARLLERKGLL